MSQIKKYISLKAAILLTVILLNVIIIKSTFINESGLYWLLILLIPLLYFLPFYFRKIKHHFLPEHKKLIADCDNHLFNSGKNEDTGLKVLFGNSYCSQPYLSSIIGNEVIIRRKNADENIQNNNEFKGNKILQIVPGYYGCRTSKYNFNAELFRQKALAPSVKMIELKLVMPSKANSISIKKSVQPNDINDKNQDLNSAIISTHTAFSNTESMVIFLDSLRQLSDAKPIGIRFCIMNKKDKQEFQKMCFAFRKTGVIPDYMVIEDCKRKSNALFDFAQAHEMSLYDGLLFISKILEMYGLKKHVKIIAATSIYTAFDVLKLRALGADTIRMQNLMIADYRKKPSVKYTADLRSNIIRNIKKIMKACGYANIQDITLPSLLQKFDFLHSRAFYKMNNQKVRIDIERKSLHPALKIS
jgi:hypothetical protein